MRRSLLFTAWLLFSAAAPLLADELSVYGGMTIELPPNVMIILDNSGSMDTVDVPGAAYDKTVIYPGSYATTKIYRCNNNNCNEFAASASVIGCTTIKNDLINKHYAAGNIRSSSPYNCSNKNDDRQTLRTGNYANFVFAGLGEKRKRLDVAKEAVSQLITQTPDVRFGLFKFNTSQGGSLVQPCGTAKATLLNSVKNFTASTWTPLAETLAETGLYFAGKKSWFNPGVTYTSPMQYRCQKNYIVLVTDGEPTEDKDSLLATGAYINGDIIGDHDGDGKDPGNYTSNGSDYLDDVAHYLFNKDCNPSLGKAANDDDDRFEKQTIRTFTIGFQTDQTLLKETAANGGGYYFTAGNASTLNEAFESIFQDIASSNGVFVAPVVPVNRLNRAFAGNRVYLGFFRPEAGGRWSGNLKSYTLTDAGAMRDVNDQPVVDAAGLLLPGSKSRWSPDLDGSDVKRGGVGELLVESAATRKIYTYLGASNQLSAAGNAFLTSNAALTNALLGVASAAERTSVISLVRGEGVVWPLGAIIHSEPVVVDYGSGATAKSYIFVGANDGMLHAFDDATGKEVWGFVPPGQLNQVRKLAGSTFGYYVDGSPTLYDLGSKKVLIFGERRGGSRYYALDVTDPLDPRWLYEINAQKLSASGIKATLGQSWSRPQPLVLKSGSTKNPVFLLAGGYDLRQDALVSGEDSVGRAIYAIDALTGALTSINFNGGNWAEMKNSILDVGGYDSNEDSAIDLVYAGDLGGKLFALRDPTAGGTWEKRVLFQIPDKINGVTMGKKFMFTPAVTKEFFGEYVFAGSGDRSNPTDKTFTDAFYAVKSDWTPNQPTLTPANLVNVGSNAIQGSDAVAKKAAATALKGGSGWYFPLPNAGEKVVAAPVVFNGIVLFSTFTPTAGMVSINDPCASNTNRGTARLYAVDYKTGGAAYKFTSHGKRIGADGEATAADRSKVIGTSIPSGPAVVILRDGPKVLVGVEGGVSTQEAKETKAFHRYFWQQLQ